MPRELRVCVELSASPPPHSFPPVCSFSKLGGLSESVGSLIFSVMKGTRKSVCF